MRCLLFAVIRYTASTQAPENLEVLQDFSGTHGLSRLSSCAKAGYVLLLQTGISHKAVVVIGAGLNCFLLGSQLRAARRANVRWAFASGALRGEIRTIGCLWRLKAVGGEKKSLFCNCRKKATLFTAGIGKSLLSHA